MSRIKHFTGSGGVPDKKGYITAFVGGDGVTLPSFGYVKIHIRHFGRKDREVILALKPMTEDGRFQTVNFEARTCPRALRCRLVKD